MGLPRHKVTVGIIQCRTGSTRLPEKALMHLAGQPMIQLYIQRCKLIKGLDVLVLATTEKPEDNVLEEIALTEGIEVFRGSENDLIDRYLKCALKYEAELVVRLCADNPLIEPEEVDNLIKSFCHEDYLHTNSGDFQNIADGLGAELYHVSALERINEMLKEDDFKYREHPHLIFNEMNMLITVPLKEDYPKVKLDVNTREEFDFVSAIFNKHGANCHVSEYIGEL